MLEIKHTLCPSCSVGCGINVVLKDESVVGTFPYKRHPVNEGKNCLNGRNSVNCFKDKIVNATISNSEVDMDKAIDEVSKELSSGNASNITVVCSGNNSLEEIEVIKDFAESKGFNVAFYANDLGNFEDVASYSDVENANVVLVIGDLLYDNPLLGRRIVHAKQNDAKVYAAGSKNSVTANIADEFADLSVQEFLDAKKSDLDESSVIIFNEIEGAEDLDKISAIASESNCKILPVYSKSNTKGALGIIESQSKDEIVELLENTKVLLVFNDDIIDEIEFDYGRISKIISFACFENKTTEASDIVIPIKSWLEHDGSFVNAMGESQSFDAVIESDILSEIEIVEKLK